MTRPDDEALLHAVARRDRGAFDAFVARHQAALFRYVRASATDDADAEDALQEAFIAVWKSAGTFRAGGSARGWLFTIARNALARAHRRRVGEPSDYEALDEIGQAAGWGAETSALDDLVDRDLLERALSTLQAQHREVLVLRELEGFDGEEVAGMLGLSLPAMKSRLHRARLHFVAALREVSDA